MAIKREALFKRHFSIMGLVCTRQGRCFTKNVLWWSWWMVWSNVHQTFQNCKTQTNWKFTQHLPVPMEHKSWQNHLLNFPYLETKWWWISHLLKKQNSYKISPHSRSSFPNLPIAFLFIYFLGHWHWPFHFFSNKTKLNREKRQEKK